MKFIKYIKAHDNFLTLILYIAILNVSFNNKVEIFSGDGDGYYMYLPAALITKDFHHLPERQMSYVRNEKGEIVIKYTCGTAYFFLPFFLAAHAYVQMFHLPADGYGVPYHNAIVICSVTWLFIGLTLLKKLLNKYFNWASVWIALLAILLGTNLYIYSTTFSTMSHVYSFSLVCAILYITDKYYENPTRWLAIMLAFMLGWLTLIRPTSILLLVFILLYKITSANDWKQRLQWLRGRAVDLLLAIPFFVLPMIPQMFYWKEVLGKYIAYSYNDEKFIYWKYPKILAVLFDTQNGLFIYAPVLLFLFYGLWIGRKQARTNLAGVLLLFTAITYVFASWHAWWFGGAYGHRSYIEYFPVFAFPLCIAFEKIVTIKRAAIRSSILLLIALFIYCNIAMTNNYKKDLMWDGPSWRWNWGMWFDKVQDAFR